MRLASLSILVALGLAAYAQEGQLIQPRVRMPGEQAVPKEITISDKQLDKWDLTGADREAVKEQVKKLNEQRAGLLKQLEGAEKERADAERKVNEAFAALERQETELRAFLKKTVGEDKAETFAVRSQLQSFIDWLRLTDAQADDLVKKELELIKAGDPRPLIAEATRASRQMVVTPPPANFDERKKWEEEQGKKRADYIKLLNAYKEFNTKWLANIEGGLTEEQKQVWQTRYRRTAYSIGGGAPK